MQTVYCLVRNCGYCGSNGFCLNRLTVINEQGVCKYLTKPGWENKVDEKWFNNKDISDGVSENAATLIESDNEASDNDKEISSEQEA